MFVGMCFNRLTAAADSFSPKLHACANAETLSCAWHRGTPNMITNQVREKYPKFKQIQRRWVMTGIIKTYDNIQPREISPTSLGSCPNAPRTQVGEVD